jgi:hypothetical protein
MNKPVIIKPFATLTGDELEIATERAAIREFDAGQPREYAEAQAAKEVAYMRAGRALPENFELFIYK